MRTASVDTLQRMSYCISTLDTSAFRNRPQDQYAWIIALFCKRNGLMSFLQQCGQADVSSVKLQDLLDMPVPNAIDQLQGEIQCIEGLIVQKCEELIRENADARENGGMEMDVVQDDVGRSDFENEDRGDSPEAFDESKWIFEVVTPSMPAHGQHQTSKRKRDPAADADDNADTILGGVAGDLARKRHRDTAYRADSCALMLGSS